MIHATDIALSSSSPAASTFIPTMDKFYNAAKKTPHYDAIVSKKESSWWIHCELWKKKKAKEKATTLREFLRVQEEAT